jgi:60 kDa SS-A/Ro ribonucleoprotein
MAVSGLHAFRQRNIEEPTQPTYKLDDWSRLNRFLILGSEGSRFDVTGKTTFVAENAASVLRCIEIDAIRVVNEIVRVSDEALAPKNDPALFALALVASNADDAGRKYAFDKLPLVARTGTHIMHFAQFAEQFRGWGRGMRKGVGGWFNAQNAGNLAYQVAKYQSRDDWSMRDLLRLAHPVPPTDQHKAIYHWITQGWDAVGSAPHDDAALRILWAMESLKQAEKDGTLTPKMAAQYVREYNLSREMLPTNVLTDAGVWSALLEKMPMTAMIRNLATMTRVGVLGPLADGNRKVLDALGSAERIHKARVHPLAILVALRQYAAGHGFRGTNTWTPVTQITDALNEAFYTAFKNVEPSGKKFLLALDVSGSMDSVGTVAGIESMNARELSAAMALITAATEPETYVVGFTSGRYSSGYGGYSYGANGRLVRNAVPAARTLDTSLSYHGITPIDISPSMRLDAVIEKISGLDFGSTDCSLPMVWAMKHQIVVDVFSVYTDNDHNSGDNPMAKLNEYRKKYVSDAKLVSVATMSSPITIGDPNDKGVLNVSGFDSAAPALISAFAAGKV